MKIKQFLYHTFISDFINENSIVVDLGGNRGEFSKFIVDNFKSKVYVIEPIPELFNSIPDISRIKKFQYCISKEKEIEISIPKDQCATIYDKNFSNKILCQGITLEEFLKKNNLDKVDLLKVDIEGAEIEMFNTTSDYIFKNINQITVEFHDFIWPELHSEIEKIKQKLKQLGFYIIEFSIKNNGDVLFIKKELISYWQYIYLKCVHIYLMGLNRVFIRLIKKL